MDFALDLLILTRNIIPYYIFFKWKEPRRKSITIALISLVIMLSVYYFIYDIIGIKSITTIILVNTIPTIVVLYKLTCYKGGKFLLTFSIVEIISVMTIFFIDIFCYINGFSDYINNFFRILVLLSMVKWLKPFANYYHKIVDSIDKGWLTVGLLSFVYYLMFYVNVYYPKNLKDRIEYLPVVLLFCVLIILSYIVIFKSIHLTKEVYEARQVEQVLSSTIETQENEIKLKEVYFKMAYTDELTGLKNRRGYAEKLQEIRSKIDSKNPVWYISFDLNNLKTVNDNQGHQRGDTLIQSTGSGLKRVFSKNGDVFRIGGDEFAVILENEFDEEKILELLKALKNILDEYSELINIDINLAYGYSLFNDYENDSIDKIIRRADKKMYENKMEMKKNNIHC